MESAFEGGQELVGVGGGYRGVIQNQAGIAIVQQVDFPGHHHFVHSGDEPKVLLPCMRHGAGSDDADFHTWFY
ncbi:MAG: hypothetical protein ACQETM_06205 [Bacteroidota bacterium]